jgi:hypothetical protein
LQVASPGSQLVIIRLGLCSEHWRKLHADKNQASQDHVAGGGGGLHDVGLQSQHSTAQYRLTAKAETITSLLGHRWPAVVLKTALVRIASPKMKQGSKGSGINVAPQGHEHETIHARRGSLNYRVAVPV